MSPGEKFPESPESSFERVRESFPSQEEVVSYLEQLAGYQEFKVEVVEDEGVLASLDITLSHPEADCLGYSFTNTFCKRGIYEGRREGKITIDKVVDEAFVEHIATYKNGQLVQT
jgi:hypothetical protein